jgi:uncharacterized membrane protein YbhN (UPF0104 family)
MWKKIHGLKKYKFVFQIILFLVLLIFFFQKVDTLSLNVNIINKNIIYGVLILQPFMFAAIVIMAKRFLFFIGGNSINLFQATKAIILAFGINVVIPGRLSELLKPIYIKENANIPLSIGTAAVILEKIMDLFSICLIVLLSLSIASINSKIYIFGILIILIVIIFCFPFIEKFLISLAEKLPWDWSKKFSKSFISHISHNFKIINIYSSLFLTFLINLFYFFSIFCFFSISGYTVLGFEGALKVTTATLIGFMLPALPGGFGTYEGAVIYVLSTYKINLSEAIVISLILHFSQIILYFLGSIIIMLKDGLGLKSLIARLKSSSD